MKTKIARNGAKLTKYFQKDNSLCDSIHLLLSSSKKLSSPKLRLKECKSLRQRPKAPHNTSQYLSTLYQHNRDSLRLNCGSEDCRPDIDGDAVGSIEDVIVTGGSLKGNYFKLFINLY